MAAERYADVPRDAPRSPTPRGASGGERGYDQSDRYSSDFEDMGRTGCAARAAVVTGGSRPLVAWLHAHTHTRRRGVLVEAGRGPGRARRLSSPSRLVGCMVCAVQVWRMHLRYICCVTRVCVVVLVLVVVVGGGGQRRALMTASDPRARTGASCGGPTEVRRGSACVGRTRARSRPRRWRPPKGYAFPHRSLTPAPLCRGGTAEPRVWGARAAAVRGAAAALDGHPAWAVRV